MAELSSAELHKLQQGVERWQNRRKDQDKMSETLALGLERPKDELEPVDPRKRKFLSYKADDDKLTRDAITLANRRVAEVDSTGRPKRTRTLPMIDMTTQKSIPITTIMKPLEQFVQDNPVKIPELLEENEEDKTTVSGNSFPEMKSLTELADENMSYWNRRNSKKMRDGVKASPKPEYSFSHIQKTLFQPYGAFPPCLNAENNECIAQVTDALRHPCDGTKPLMSFPTETQMRSFEMDNSGVVFEQNYCEFCYRFSVNALAYETANDIKTKSVEIASRYYAIGLGNYSQSAMIQPKKKRGVTQLDGIFGNIRFFDTSDFIPVVGVLEKNKIVKTISVDEYKKLGITNVVFGWEEVKGIYQLNEKALLEWDQINPYDRVIIRPQDARLDAVLRGYFMGRAVSADTDYSHIFSDLMESVADPEYLEKPYPENKSSLHKTRWLYYCLHSQESPPDTRECSIYFVMIAKLNAARTILETEELPDGLREKVALFIAGYLPLFDWIEKNGYRTNEELTSLRFFERNSSPISGLANFYPVFATHLRGGDERFLDFEKKIYSRKSPLEFVQDFYSADEYRDGVKIEKTDSEKWELHSNLPEVKILLQKPKYSGLTAASYTNLSNIYHELCTHISDLYEPKFPSYDKKPPPEADRKIWKRKYGEKVLRKIETAFDNVINVLLAENQRYFVLLKNLSTVVFCDFMSTVEQLKAMQNDQMTVLLETAGILNITKNMNLDITLKGVTGETWDNYMLLAACLLRVAVFEELERIEITSRKALKQNLLLMRNSHLSLFSRLTENKPRIKTDEEMSEKLDKKAQQYYLTELDYVYPYPTRELHPGMLPNLTQGLIFVNFIGESGAEEHPWVKINGKKAWKCCGQREFSVMLKKMCADPNFYRYTALEIRLSLMGTYEHNLYRPCFLRALQINEFFEHIMQKEVLNQMEEFILDNQTLVIESTSESLSYMLDCCPFLTDILHKIYKEWFDWPIKTNMDMVRFCFDRDGHIGRIEEIVYERAKFNSNKLIYRHNETSFIDFMCTEIDNFDILRYQIAAVLQEKHQVTNLQKDMITRFVHYVGPEGDIELSDMRLVYMKTDTLDKIAEIFKVYKTACKKNTGAAMKKEEVTDLVQQQFKQMEANQYTLMSFFFDTLKRYRSIRAIRLTNSLILEQQIAKICEKRNVKHISDLPPLATKIAYSPCCGYFKNSFPLKPNAEARGFDEIMLDMLDGTNTCGKKQHRTAKKARVLRINRGKNEKVFEKKVARQQQRENKKLICSETEVMTIDVLGEVVFSKQPSKIPKSKKAAKNSTKRRKRTMEVPVDPYWMTPCCGKILDYDWKKFTPNGYACMRCSPMLEITNELKLPVCESCYNTIPKNKAYKVERGWDDVKEKLRRQIFCSTCYKPWKHNSKGAYVTSHVIASITDSSYASSVISMI